MNKLTPNEKYSDPFQENSSPDNFMLYESNQFTPQTQFNPLKLNGRNHILNLKQTTIKEVWDYNFEEEIYKIMDLIENYNIIAVDTEFPGVKTGPKKWKDDRDFEYQLIRENVNVLKLIQIGITISNEKGEVPEESITWQFNFKFDLNKDDNLPEAISLLKNSGINFEVLKNKGIDHDLFAEFLVSSGVVLNDDIKWISFHGGFDFAYLLKMLNSAALPESEKAFYNDMNLYFPKFYDIKYLIKDFENLKDDGLNKLAASIAVDRIGPQHQAGSDSLVTLAAFFKLKETYLKNDESILENGENIIYGIGAGFVENKDYHWNYKYTNNNYYDYGNEQTSMFYNYLMMNNPFFSQNNYTQNDSYFRNVQVVNYNNFLNNQQFPFTSGNATTVNGNEGNISNFKTKNIKNK